MDNFDRKSKSRNKKYRTGHNSTPRTKRKTIFISFDVKALTLKCKIDVLKSFSHSFSYYCFAFAVF